MSSTSPKQKTPFTGVRRRKAGSWEARIDGRHLGTFETALEAEEALKAAETPPAA
jgi:hypothetical protein